MDEILPQIIHPPNICAFDRGIVQRAHLQVVDLICRICT